MLYIWHIPLWLLMSIFTSLWHCILIFRFVLIWFGLVYALDHRGFCPSFLNWECSAMRFVFSVMASPSTFYFEFWLIVLHQKLRTRPCLKTERWTIGLDVTPHLDFRDMGGRHKYWSAGNQGLVGHSEGHHKHYGGDTSHVNSRHKLVRGGYVFRAFRENKEQLSMWNGRSGLSLKGCNLGFCSHFQEGSIRFPPPSTHSNMHTAMPLKHMC